MSFPVSRQLYGNPVITGFNQIFQGSNELTDERFHTYSISYIQFNLFGGLNINAAMFYNRKTQGYKQRTRLDGIDQFLAMTMFDLPQNNIRATVNVSKKIGKVKYSLDANTSYNEFYQLVDESVDKNISRTINIKSKVETYFDTAPNLELTYSYVPSRYGAAFGTSKFRSNILTIGVHDEFCKNFVLDADYSHEIFNNGDTGSENTYQILNTKLFYQLEDSAWGFEIGVSNIFNTQRRQRSSFTDFLVSDRSSFILPIILLFKISYNL